MVKLYISGAGENMVIKVYDVIQLIRVLSPQINQVTSHYQS